MKNYTLALLLAFVVSSCTHKQEVQFKLPDVPYAVSGEAVVSKKEFTFPTVPYAQ
jgi:predicted transcriptional regulator